MRLQIFSDLHFEFQRDGGESFVASCDPSGIDVLVLAGDIAVAHGIPQALGFFAERYPEVVYVHGNHEYYGSNRREVVALTERACRRHSNVHWLDGDVLSIRGQRFVGAPLWFPETEETHRQRAILNDFRQIADYEDWVYVEHERQRAFLTRELTQGDVVVTHHLPSLQCVTPKYRDSPLTCFFVAGVHELLEARRPALWIHGHTHASLDFQLADTRVVCNPYGYFRIEENAGFDRRKAVDIEALEG